MILTSPEVELIRYTPDPEQALSEAFAVCRLKEPDLERVKRCIAQGHLSPLEHVVYTFKLKVSRVCWSQIQEYRTASHTAQSHRFWVPEPGTSHREWEFIVPPDFITSMWPYLESTTHAYWHMIEKGCKPETARLVLPMAVAITVIWTQDLRNLLRFWQERIGEEAQWEIRKVARRTRELVMETVPNLRETLKE